MSTHGNLRTSVSALMGTSIRDANGHTFGSVAEFAVLPQVDATRVQGFVVRLANSDRKSARSLVLISALERSANGVLRLLRDAAVSTVSGDEEYLLLERDLLDQQIIDVHGHKVVRVNDVDMVWESGVPTPDVAAAGLAAGPAGGARTHLILRIAEVEVGMRGAIRRLLKGLPNDAVNSVASHVRAAVIPWDFVDLIDRDPARRVRLKIEQDRLSRMHPSDLADILEELAPAERHALFSSLDEEVAAEALEEVELKTQKNLIESIDSERLAGIFEEMDPGAAADLLSELSDERSDAILEEMNPKERHDVEELLEYESDSAAGLMTTEYVALESTASVAHALAALRAFEGDLETLTDIFVTDPERHVHGLVSLSKLLFAPPESPLSGLIEEHVVSSAQDASARKVAELFDKYNLRCLPVLDADRRVVGVVHAENVIAWLRNN